MDDWPWARLADAVRQRREDRGLSQRALGQLAGTTDRMISSIERAERDTYQQRTLRAVSRALGWTPDSIDRILAGDDPVEVEPVTGDQLPTAAELAAEFAAMQEKLDKLTGLVERWVSDPARADRR